MLDSETDTSNTTTTSTITVTTTSTTTVATTNTVSSMTSTTPFDARPRTTASQRPPIAEGWRADRAAQGETRRANLADIQGMNAFCDQLSNDPEMKGLFFQRLLADYGLADILNERTNIGTTPVLHAAVEPRRTLFQEADGAEFHAREPMLQQPGQMLYPAASSFVPPTQAPPPRASINNPFRPYTPPTPYI